MRIELEVSEENESTESPWWAVIDPQQNMSRDLHVAASQITGPFFSRAEGEEYLARRHYDYSKRADVYCFSGCWSSQYKDACRIGAVKAPQKVPEAGKFLILSHHPPTFQKGLALWWNPNSSGYTIEVDKAGRYTKEEADTIVKGAPGDNEAVPEEVATRLSRHVVNFFDLPRATTAKLIEARRRNSREERS